jgi:DNA-binding protein Fis
MWHCLWSACRQCSFNKVIERCDCMDIHKKISFTGNLKKLHEDDENPIEIPSVNILCCRNGAIFLEIDAPTNVKISQKRMGESAPIYKASEKELEDPFSGWENEPDEEPIQSPYEGDYIIEGVASEGWSIRAEVVEPPGKVFFGADEETELKKENQVYLIELNNLYIDYHPYYKKGENLKALYGLSGLDLNHDFSVNSLDSKYEISFVSLSKDKKNENLSTDIVIRRIDNNAKETLYDTYFEWFKLLITFATGRSPTKIYKIEITPNNSVQKKVEHWPGREFSTRRHGIAVIEQAHLPSFVQQCASKVTLENFRDNGLGLALRCYTEAFSSNTVSVRFILLCTVLETLNKHHSTEISSRLLPKSTYKEIRKKILDALNEYEQSLDDEEITSQYQIFRKKVEKSFAEGSFNQIGSLRTSLKLMLEFYKTPYEDLFPNLEFITIRDNIVHTGFGGDNIFSDLCKLGNLVVRLVLSILQYRGYFIESRKINGLLNCEKHGLAYKIFPFEKDS